MSSLDATKYGTMSAPEPMAPLKHVIITPENVATEARLSRAKPLGWFQIQKLKRQAESLEREARKMAVDKVSSAARLTEMRSSLQILQTYREELERDLQLTPFDPHVQTQFNQLMETALPLWKEFDALKAQLNQVVSLEKQAASIRQRILDNPAVIERAKEEDKLIKIQREEARAYEQLMIDRFTQQGLCYRWVDKQGNKKVDQVKFSWCEITPDAIYYKISASHKTMFGGYKTKLPYGVFIADLVKDETLFELSLSCQRQVTAKYSPTGGAWIIVHRLDTNDGLVNQVRYASVMEHYPRKYQAKLPICVGVGLNLNVIWLNIADYPHMLVAGFTGSGKSNFINAIICTLITQHSPEDVRIVLVDLKDGVEFSAYERIPHLHGKVVDTVPDLADSLEQLEAIMSDRNRQLKGKAKSLAQYNMKYPDAPLPRIVCIIDEVASIMNQGDSTKRINHSLRQLTAKGRAPGVHIILCTQRPTVDVIDGGVKVNLAARIVGRMPSSTDSQAVIGSGDAKDLAAVPGRMLLQISPDPTPVQTPFIEEEDVAIALKRALEWETPAPLPVPEGFNQDAEWTPEKIVELSLTFMGGNLGHHRIWEEIKNEGGITNAQLRQMVKSIWAMDCIPFEGKEYRVERGKGHIRKLVEIVRPDEPVSEA